MGEQNEPTGACHRRSAPGDPATADRDRYRRGTRMRRGRGGLPGESCCVQRAGGRLPAHLPLSPESCGSAGEQRGVLTEVLSEPLRIVAFRRDGAVGIGAKLELPPKTLSPSLCAELVQDRLYLLGTGPATYVLALASPLGTAPAGPSWSAKLGVIRQGLPEPLWATSRPAAGYG